jgi:probable blue pigment (indigoidine) exporter
VVGIAGMALLLLSPQSRWDAAGIAAALVGATSMATGTYLARRWKSSLPLLAFTGWQLLLAGLMLLPAAWWLDPPLQALSLGAGLG